MDVIDIFRNKLAKDDRSVPQEPIQQRRSGLLDAFSLKLPSPIPQLTLPPTPVSPASSDKTYATLEWRERAPSSPVIQPRKTTGLPPTPPSELCELERKTHESPEPVATSGLEGILATGYRLHPCFINDYDIIDELGWGGFGVVVRAARKSDGKQVAVKLMWRERMASDAWAQVVGWDIRHPMTTFTVPKEAYLLRKLNHPGIIGYVDFFEDQTFAYLLMEYFGTAWSEEPLRAPLLQAALGQPTASLSKHAEGSARQALPPRSGSVSDAYPNRPGMPMRRSSCDLFECIDAHEYLDEDTARYVFKQIVDAVCYLHSKGIVHCDLKDENIVIDENYRVKLIDFGSALMLDPHREAPYHSSFKGTLNFASPEVLRGECYQAPQAEVWALGCILSVLLTGKAPFDSSERAVRAQISIPTVPVSKEAWSLMMGCLCYRATARLTAVEVQEHPWFK